MNKMKTWQGSLGVSDYHGIVSPAYIVCKVRGEVWPRYFHHLLRSRPYIDRYNEISFGIRVAQWDMRYDDFKQTPLWLPSLSEQQAIALFLDREDRRINRFIRAKRRLIDLLNEQKQAIIHQAVTRGLDPSVPLKPSGIEWLGDIPAHWQVRKLRSIANIFNGSTPSRAQPAFWQDGTLPWISSGRVNDYVVTTPSELITPLALTESSLRLVPSGSVIVGLVGQGKTRGMSAITDIDTYINQNLAAIVPRGLAGARWILHVLTASYQSLRDQGRGGNQEALNCEILGAFRIPVPPFDEQLALIDQIQTMMSEVDGLISASLREIEFIREYRTRLIADVVTGTLDVRNHPDAIAGTTDTMLDSGPEDIDLDYALGGTEPLDEEIAP